QVVSDTVSRGGRVLFVGTKPQASSFVAEAAKRSAQYYVDSKWFGGMITNWKTISNSIQRLRKLDEVIEKESQGLTKKERLNIERKRDKLERALGGIRDMGGLPDLMFVLDTNRERLAVEEARRLRIPIVAVTDTNCDPDRIDYVIPGNDDSSRSIALFCDLIASAALDGLARQQRSSGKEEIGSSEELSHHFEEKENKEVKEDKEEKKEDVVS
ncbi:30S ribosomal protein S2, partial [Candidatus Liberibacter sp.]|uniref:30S ribosomal protein S2 n=1 Tax=Candidatus Liberibacter sp. TaxID=34022 RepID=UPI0015F75641